MTIQCKLAWVKVAEGTVLAKVVSTAPVALRVIEDCIWMSTCAHPPATRNRMRPQLGLQSSEDFHCGSHAGGWGWLHPAEAVSVLPTYQIT